MIGFLALTLSPDGRRLLAAAAIVGIAVVGLGMDLWVKRDHPKGTWDRIEEVVWGALFLGAIAMVMLGLVV